MTMSKASVSSTLQCWVTVSSPRHIGRPENCSAGGGGGHERPPKEGEGVGEMDVRDRPLNKGQFCRFV